MIGNAVPVKLAEVIARKIKNDMQTIEEKSVGEDIASYNRRNVLQENMVKERMPQIVNESA